MERERGGGRGEGEEERGEPSRVAEGGGRRKSKGSDRGIATCLRDSVMLHRRASTC